MRTWLVAAGVAAIAIVIIMFARCDREPAPSKIATGSSSTIGSTTREVTRTRPRIPRPVPAGGLRLEGQVIDEHDQPVAGAVVRFYNFDPETVTDEDGSFVFEHLAAHDNYQLTASKGEDTWCEMVRATLSESSEPVILRLHPGAVATVHVVDGATGKGIAGARLGTRITDDTGHVHVRGLRPGGSNITIISIEADGYEHSRVKITDLDLANPADNVFRVELKRGAAVRGTVVGPGGEPLTDAWVTASGQGRGDTQTDARGTWSLTLAAGTNALVASAPGFVDSAAVTVETDGVTTRDGITFRLQRAPEDKIQPVFDGIVVDEHDRPVAGAEITVEAAAGRSREVSDAQGRFRIVLAAGARYASLRARKGELASAEVTVNPGDREALRLVIARTSIAGIVVDTRGRPAPGVRVYPRSVMVDASAITDAKGHFELSGLAPGDHALLVAHGEQQYARIDQGVVASTGDRDVKLVVTDIGNVSGRVVLEGKPVAYYGVYVSDADPILEHPLIVRAQDGRFRLKGLVAGAWSLYVAGPSFGRKRVSIAVPEDGEVELGDIVVDRGRVVRGRVTDGSGTGVGGATVTVHERDSPRDALSRAVEGTGAAITDAAGAFRIPALAPPLDPTPRRIVATHPTRGVSIERLLAEDATDVNLVLLKPGGIDGRLEGMETGVFCARVDDPSFVYAASPDATGRFRFDNLPPGAYRLRPNGLTATTVLVTVVSGQRARASLVVPAERIELAIASCTKSVTLWTEDGLDEVAGQACGTSFTVPPGTYRACSDGTCTVVKVTPAPAKQTR
jgi:hypothetical protein